MEGLRKGVANLEVRYPIGFVELLLRKKKLLWVGFGLGWLPSGLVWAWVGSR